MAVNFQPTQGLGLPGQAMPQPGQPMQARPQVRPFMPGMQAQPFQIPGQGATGMPPGNVTPISGMPGFQPGPDAGMPKPAPPNPQLGGVMQAPPDPGQMTPGMAPPPVMGSPQSEPLPGRGGFAPPPLPLPPQAPPPMRGPVQGGPLQGMPPQGPGGRPRGPVDADPGQQGGMEKRPRLRRLLESGQVSEASAKRAMDKRRVATRKPRGAGGGRSLDRVR